ncbi:MAG: glycosyltransferase [Solirubrobacterales bacterium]
MRIAVLGSRGYPSYYGGYETFVREFVPHAIEAGHDVVAYCRWAEDGRRAWSRDGAECRHTRGIDTKFFSTLSHGLTSSLDVRKRGIDVALVLNVANAFYIPLIQSAGVPVAINVDGLEWERGKWGALGSGVFRLAARIAASQAACIVADSRAIAEIWAEEYGVCPQFIPYGGHVLDERDVDELDPLGIPPGEFVLTVARLVPENNLALALDGLELVRDGGRLPHVIVGSSGMRSELDLRAEQLAESREDVWYLGHVSNQRLLSQLWSHCATYVHGHSVGGTNPALLQALGAGAPTVAYDCRFNREVVGDLDVYFDSPEGLAEQLRRMLTSTQHRERAVEHGRERVRTRYTWPDACDQYLTLLESLVEERGRVPALAA